MQRRDLDLRQLLSIAGTILRMLAGLLVLLVILGAFVAAFFIVVGGVATVLALAEPLLLLALLVAAGIWTIRGLLALDPRQPGTTGGELYVRIAATVGLTGIVGEELDLVSQRTSWLLLGASVALCLGAIGGDKIRRGLRDRRGGQA